ncbi:mechanosensitive ion channel family protein [Candidatus Dojkabacteria bacterium]|uniref:Mechanosensitive ion channel family protein n=1 Tax=Candidatus Dojkabacteria bacterium TaxID=2099670 RepID=A0A955L9Q4_9BACT|nr:mechanosensitive ion channel family protein [Candidatus Dojkabacteria bacterium]
MNIIIRNIQYIAYQTTKLPDYTQSILLFVCILIAFQLTKQYIIKYIREHTKKTKFSWDNMITEILDHIKTSLLLVIALYFSTKNLTFSTELENVLHFTYQAALIVQVLLLVQAAIRIFFRNKMQQVTESNNKDLITLYDFSSKILASVIWIIGGVFFLSNIGYNVASLVTSLGIGGLAVALAVQNILKDILSGFLILLNKPFQIGDFIKFEDPKQAGTVEKIGLHSTIIRTVNSEELIVANSDILNSRIFNLRSRQKRRTTFDIFLSLDTSAKQIEQLVTDIQNLLEENEAIDGDKSRVKFDTYNQFAAVINVVIRMKGNKLETFLDTKEEINLAIKKLVDKRKINFAEHHAVTSS